MTGPLAQTSRYGGARVYIDPLAINPLLDDATQAIPATVAAAKAQQGDPPTMFESGDVPPFIASGVDPQILTKLPWTQRHAAAMEPDAGKLLGMVEQAASGTPELNVVQTPGLAAYAGRMSDWLSGKWTNPNFTGPDTDAVNAADDALYERMFGDQAKALADKRAAINAANPPKPRTAADWAGRAQR